MAINSTNVSFSHLQTQYNSIFDPDLSNPISLSEFRDATFSSGDPVPSGSNTISINTHLKGRTFEGSSPSITGDLGQELLFTGNQGTSLKTYTKDLSTFGINSGTTLVGKSVHIYLRYESGTYWQQDPQLYQIVVNGTTHLVGLNTGSFRYSYWKTTYRTTNVAYNHSSSWNTVTSSTSPTGRWHRDTYGTPSSSTGVSVGNNGAIYFEGSSGSYSKDVYLRSPSVTLTSNTVSLKMYGYGASINKMYMGVYIL